MNNSVLQHALEYARRGWPVFPCQPGKKIPATRHGYLDAVTDPGQIYAWFGRDPGLNLAIATGAPGIDVLDVDQRGEAGDGFPALAQLEAAGLLDAAIATVRTPSGGLHFYFTGSQQRSGHLPARHIDFLSRGGYILAPPSQVNGHPYQHVTSLAQHGELDWRAVTDILEPARGHAPQPPGAPARPAAAHARWHQGRPAGPLALRAARGQPQQRPVLGRQPRPGSKPGRRPQPPGRRRPPGGARRTRDHRDPPVRPAHRPGPPRTRRPRGRRSRLT